MNYDCELSVCMAKVVIVLFGYFVVLLLSRTKVRCRYQSRRVPARGVFQGARVVRGHDWRWNDQDGGAGKEGTVLEISGWHSESSVSACTPSIYLFNIVHVLEQGRDTCTL